MAANISRVDNQSRNTFGSRILRPFTELFGLSRSLAALALAIFAGIVGLAVWYFIHLAPPKVITISAGPEDSMFWRLRHQLSDSTREQSYHCAHFDVRTARKKTCKG